MLFCFCERTTAPIPVSLASASRIKSLVKSGKRNMGVEVRRVLSVAKAFSHSVVQPRVQPNLQFFSTRRCSGLAMVAKFFTN